MPQQTEYQTPQIGWLYWCDTARSNIGSHFSGKGRRPVLYIGKIGDYAAVYPCSTVRGSAESSEWIGSAFGVENTYVIYSWGLFYAPLADLHSPGFAWNDWKTWRITHRKVLEADLLDLKKMNKARFAAAGTKKTGSNSHRYSTSLESRIDPVLWETLQESVKPPPPPPKPPPKPKPAPKPLSPQDEFLNAVNAILPYQILRDKEDS